MFVDLRDYLRAEFKAHDPQTLDEAQALSKLFEKKGRPFLKYIQTEIEMNRGLNKKDFLTTVANAINASSSHAPLVT